jgi:hypothetical protein
MNLERQRAFPVRIERWNEYPGASTDRFRAVVSSESRLLDFAAMFRWYNQMRFRVVLLAA